MVRTVISQQTFEVEVHVQRTEESDMQMYANPRGLLASDAFDYFTHGIGYFRYAIQEMEAYKISLCVLNQGVTIEEAEITRD